jgi:mono/diheme cytochrome c family protein
MLEKLFVLPAAFLLAQSASLAAAERVTFSETIAPIIYSNCVTCHRPGEAAPFSLISYSDVSRRADLVATVTRTRYMPPWHAAHGYGEFADERRLSDAQIAAIAEWVKQGKPEGDPAKMPKLPKFPDGWHLGKPDLVVEMPASYELPASGPDIYRNFVVPTNLTEDKWVRAIEFRPSARKVVHHVLFAYDASGAARKLDGRDGHPGFGGMSAIGVAGAAGNAGSLGGWAVGATPAFMPEGVALPLPKGSDIVLQMHFHLTGKPETEKSVVGIYFADKAPERRVFALQAPALFGFGAGIDIPAGEKKYTIEDSLTLPVDVKAFTVGSHAHYVAKEMKATATLPDGSTQPLLWIQDWDFAWQDRYNYKTPLVLPKGTRIDVRLTYDNSADNPHNPSNPPKRVTWGEQSFDEMGAVSLGVQALHQEDEAALRQLVGDRTKAAIAKALRDGTVRRYQEQQTKNSGGNR